MRPVATSPSLPVHVDAALEGRAVGDEDAWSPDVSDHAAVAAQLGALAGVDVASHGAVDRDGGGLDVRLDHPTLLDDDVLAQADAPLDGAPHDEVLVAGDLAVDHDGAAYDGVGHESRVRRRLGSEDEGRGRKPAPGRRGISERGGVRL